MCIYTIFILLYYTYIHTYIYDCMGAFIYNTLYNYGRCICVGGISSICGESTCRVFCKVEYKFLSYSVRIRLSTFLPFSSVSFAHCTLIFYNTYLYFINIYKKLFFVL